MPKTNHPTDLDRMREICLALPEATEGVSHSAPTWYVRKRPFAMLWADGHHDQHYPHLWLANLLEAQEELIADDPDVYFRPPYVGHRGWIGVRLDVPVDWDEVAALCRDAYRLLAPKRLAALVED